MLLKQVSSPLSPVRKTFAPLIAALTSRKVKCLSALLMLAVSQVVMPEYSIRSTKIVLNRSNYWTFGVLVSRRKLFWSKLYSLDSKNVQHSLNCSTSQLLTA